MLDASVLIGYLDGADSHHEAAQALLTRVVDDDLGANPLTLAEVLVVPARTGRLDTLLSVLRDIDVQALPFPTDTAVQLAELRADTGLKMPDCCVLLRRQKRERTSRRSTLGSRRRPKRAVCPFSGADLTTSHLWPIHDTSVHAAEVQLDREQGSAGGDSAPHGRRGVRTVDHSPDRRQLPTRTVMPRSAAALASRSSKVASSAGLVSSAVSNTQQSGIRRPVRARSSASCPATSLGNS